MDTNYLKEIGERLRLIRNEYRYTQNDFADKLNIKQNTLSQYENGMREISTEVKRALHEVFHINFNWLMTGQGEMELGPEDGVGLSAEDEVVLIDELDIRASAGYGVENFEPEIRRRVSVPAGAVFPHDAKKVKMFEVFGDSMEPTFYSGDMLTFVEGLVGGNGIYLLNRENELYVKRIQFHPGSSRLTIISDNPDYGSEVVDAAKEHVSLIGKVIILTRYYN